MSRRARHSVLLLFGLTLSLVLAATFASSIPPFNTASNSASIVATIEGIESFDFRHARTAPVGEPEILLFQKLREDDLLEMDLPLVAFEEGCDPELLLVILEGEFVTRGGIGTVRDQPPRSGYLAMVFLTTDLGHALMRSTFSATGGPFSTALGDHSLRSSVDESVAVPATQGCELMEAEDVPMDHER